MQLQIEESLAYLRSKGISTAGTAIVLGTGLSHMVGALNIISEVPFTSIPSFVESTVAFHKGRLLYGTIKDYPIIIMQGRFHYYEGYTMQQITYPVRVLHALGVKQIIFTNAAGGLRTSFRKGDLVLINDHINLQPENPLRGVNEKGRNRFLDMSEPYDEKLSKKIKRIAKGLKLKMHTGVYASVAGPNLETRAEYRMLQNIGADMVGMSTVPEVIIAKYLGLQCAAISIITDECDPDHLKPVSIDEIIAVAEAADVKLTGILSSFISSLTKA